MPSMRSGCLAAASVALIAAGCGSSEKKAASPSHDSPDGAMAGLIEAMKSGNNAQVAQWLAPTPPSDRQSLTTTERLHKAIGLAGGLFWEADKLEVKETKESGDTAATVTLSGPIVWCLGTGATDAKASCAQPNGAQGQAPVYKAVKQAGKWYIDFDINKGRNLPGNPAVAGSSKSSTTPTTPSSSGSAEAKSKLQAAGADFNEGQRRFFKQAAADYKAGNLAAVKADASQFRDVIFEFDADVRKIKFLPDKQSDVNEMLEGDRTIIAELDAIGSANTRGEVARLLRRFTRDKSTTIKAINKVINEL